MSSRSLGTLTIDLVAKTGMFEQGMDRAARSADQRMKNIEKSAKSVGVAIGSIGAGLVTGFGLIVRNTVKAEQEIAQLDAILKSTGNAAGFTRDQLVKMSQELQGKSIFSSGEIVEAQTRLLSYSGVLGENIPRAMQSIIDQSARLGISLTQSAETIGRALESPAKAAAALAQQGFGAAFTKEVRGTIDALVAAGREAEAQVMILEILEESYGGAAEAARNTLGGALTALKNTLSDVLTGGDGTLSGLTKAVNDLNDAINDPKVRQGFADIVDGAIRVATQLANAIPKVADFGSEVSAMVRRMGIDAGAFVEHVGAILDGAKQIFSLGLADGTLAEAEARLLNAKRTRKDMIAEERRERDRAAIEARARLGLANLNYVQDDTVIPGFTKNPPPRPPGTNPPGGGGSKRISEESKEAARLQSAYESLMASMRERIALFNSEGDAAKVRYDTEHGSLKALDDARKQALIAEAEQYDLMVKRRQEDEARLRMAEEESDRIREGLDYGKQVLADLQFELELMRMTNAERVTAIQLREMESEAVAEYGAAIAQANRDIEESMKQVELMDGARREFANFFEDVFSGTKSVKDAFSDMLNSIHQMIVRRISENWVEQLFGQMGSSQGGSAGGGWFQALAGLFGGGRANGGWANPNTMYEVNERGMEMATVRGRDYLLTGNAPVEITPNHRLGKGDGGSVTQVFNNPVMSNLQTDSQRAREQARKAQREMARA